MVQINPGDLPDLPVEQLAQFLLGCAREDPTLLARSNSGPVVQRDTEVRMPVARPIDLSATWDAAGVTPPAGRPDAPSPADPHPVDRVTPADAPTGPVAGRIAARRVEPWQQRTETRGMPADDLGRRMDATARPPAPSVTPTAALPGPAHTTPRPIEPLGQPGGQPATPVDALFARSGIPVDGTTRPGEALDRPLGPLATPVDAPFFSSAIPAGAIQKRSGRRGDPVGPSPTLAGTPIGRPGIPIDPTSGPFETPGGPIDPSGVPDAMSGPPDATARVIAHKLQLRRSDAREDPELEELVSIAVACARRAEDAVQQAREISWMARRRMTLVAAVTGASVLAASAVAVIDRYRAFGEQGLPGTASALVAAPFPTAESSPPGSSARPEPASGPAVAAGPEQAQVAATVHAAVGPAEPAGAARSPASVISPPSVVADSRPAAAPASSVPGPAVPPTASTTETPEPTQPAETQMASASLDAPPLSPPPPASHPVRHVHRVARRVIYYPSGPGLLLAQVVYGVRRNLYEIFH